MQCYHFEVIRSKKKLFSFSSIVNSFYSGHCWDLELLSSLARVRYGRNLFQSNICKIMRGARKRGPQSPSLFPFPPYPSIPYPYPLHFMVPKKSKNLLVLWFIHILKTAHLKQFKGMQRSKLDKLGGYHLLCSRGHMTEVPCVSKAEYCFPSTKFWLCLH